MYNNRDKLLLWIKTMVLSYKVINTLFTWSKLHTIIISDRFEPYSLDIIEDNIIFARLLCSLNILIMKLFERTMYVCSYYFSNSSVTNYNLYTIIFNLSNSISFWLQLRKKNFSNLFFNQRHLSSTEDNPKHFWWANEEQPSHLIGTSKFTKREPTDIEIHIIRHN